MKSISLKEFKPEGTTQSTGHITTDEQAAHELFYRSYTTGADGARYELLREKHHTTKDVEKARKYLRKNFDVVGIIAVLNEKAGASTEPVLSAAEGLRTTKSALAKPLVMGKKPFTAYVHFAADPSVGSFSYGYLLEVPEIEEEGREYYRQRIKDLYTQLDGEFSVSSVTFSDEKDNDF